ncbi:hypothetical protein IWZ03DRAFT_90563 [Phyllosticta citriasiana]|uniref:Uncharacterized protein n=2 Tax=Phyllosticta citriasiana TaxID=595635 RepID=A0ABR1K827_9PEZI
MPPSNCDLASNAPAMLQWGQEDNPRHIGLGHPVPSSSIIADLGFDAAQHTALLRFRVHIWLKCQRKRIVLFILVNPAQIRNASKLEIEKIPPLVTNSFVAGLQQCSGAQDVFALHILLRDPAGFKIIAPSNVTDLDPNTKPSGQTLNALQSLSYAQDFVVYLPASPGLTDRIDAFCDEVRNGALAPSGNLYELKTLYGGIGGVDVCSLLQAVASESPPAYDGVIDHVSEPEGSLSAKRLLSRGNSPCPNKKSRSEDHKAELNSWANRLLQVELQVSAMRGRIAHHGNETPGSPTEDASIADRFDRLDDEVRALNDSMNSIQEQMQRESKRRDEQLEQLRQQIQQLREQKTERHVEPGPEATRQQSVIGSSSITPEVEELLQDWVQNYLYDHGWNETQDYVDDLIEDGVLGIKVAHREWLEEQVEQDLPDVGRAALRRLLPDLLVQTELRVGFVEGGGGWLWRSADGVVQDDDEDET